MSNQTGEMPFARNGWPIRYTVSGGIVTGELFTPDGKATGLKGSGKTFAAMIDEIIKGFETSPYAATTSSAAVKKFVVDDTGAGPDSTPSPNASAPKPIPTKSAIASPKPGSMATPIPSPSPSGQDSPNTLPDSPQASRPTAPKLEPTRGTISPPPPTRRQQFQTVPGSVGKESEDATDELADLAKEIKNLGKAAKETKPDVGESLSSGRARRAKRPAINDGSPDDFSPFPPKVTAPTPSSGGNSGGSSSGGGTGSGGSSGNSGGSGSSGGSGGSQPPSSPGSGNNAPSWPKSWPKMRRKPPAPQNLRMPAKWSQVQRKARPNPLGLVPTKQSGSGGSGRGSGKAATAPTPFQRGMRGAFQAIRGGAGPAAIVTNATVAALGPFGLALGAATGATAAFTSGVRKAADTAYGLAPQTSQATIQADFRSVTNDIRRSRENDRQLAGFVNVQSDISEAIADIRNRFIGIGLDAFLPTLEKIANAINVLSALLPELSQEQAELAGNAFVSAMSGPGAILLDMLSEMRKENENKNTGEIGNFDILFSGDDDAFFNSQRDEPEADINRLGIQ